MAQLTRKFLRALGVEDDKIDEIVTVHQDTLEEIKAERDSLKESASKLAEAQAEVTRLTTELEQVKKTNGDAEAVRQEFNAYKEQVETERRNATVDAAVLDACKKAGIQRESLQRMVAKDFDRSKVEMDANGAVTNADALVSMIQKDYPDCIATTQINGTPPTNPPAGGNVRMTKEQIAAITDNAERRAAIKANLDLFE